MIRQLVDDAVIAIAPDKTLQHAALLMHTNDIGSLAVEVDGFLKGIITERDILDACADAVDLDASPVSEWMTSYPDTFHPDMPVEEAAAWMTVAGYRHLPVVEAGKALGVVSIKDILWALTGPPMKSRVRSYYQGAPLVG